MSMHTYLKHVAERLCEIESSQEYAIRKAASLIADGIEENRLLYVYGAGGHTSLVTGEMFFRIGGLANIYPICEYGLTALSQARKFIALERCEGLGRSLISSSGIGTGDVLLLFHTIGVNATCIEAAKEARRLGAKVIGIASRFWQDETSLDAEIRSAGRENLRDIVDIYIDDCNPVDDAVIEFDALTTGVGAVSGIGTFAIAHMIEVCAVEECLNRGVIPPIWSNANTAIGAERNAALFDKYSSRIPML